RRSPTWWRSARRRSARSPPARCSTSRADGRRIEPGPRIPVVRGAAAAEPDCGGGPKSPTLDKTPEPGRTPMTSNITRKEFLASAASLAVAMPAIWRSERAFAQGAVTLKLGHPDTPLHPTQAVATKFSELVAAKTGG